MIEDTVDPGELLLLSLVLSSRRGRTAAALAVGTRSGVLPVLSGVICSMVNKLYKPLFGFFVIVNIFFVVISFLYRSLRESACKKST